MSRPSLIHFVQLPATVGAGGRTRINGLHEAPDGSGRLFVNDLRGPLYVISGTTVTTYLDLAVLRPLSKTSPGLASGFNSFVFHPGFASNGLFYAVHAELRGIASADSRPGRARADRAPLRPHGVAGIGSRPRTPGAERRASWSA